MVKYVFAILLRVHYLLWQFILKNKWLWCFQNCTSVLQSLSEGSFGSCEKTIQDYQAQCHTLFPHAHAFLLPTANAKTGTEGMVLTNGSLS